MAFRLKVTARCTYFHANLLYQPIPPNKTIWYRALKAALQHLLPVSPVCKPSSGVTLLCYCIGTSNSHHHLGVSSRRSHEDVISNYYGVMHSLMHLYPYLVTCTVHFWGAEGAPILFSVLGFSMASCS